MDCGCCSIPTCKCIVCNKLSEEEFQEELKKYKARDEES